MQICNKNRHSKLYTNILNNNSDDGNDDVVVINLKRCGGRWKRLEVGNWRGPREESGILFQLKT